MAKRVASTWDGVPFLERNPSLVVHARCGPVMGLSPEPSHHVQWSGKKARLAASLVPMNSINKSPTTFSKANGMSGAPTNVVSQASEPTRHRPSLTSASAFGTSALRGRQQGTSTSRLSRHREMGERLWLRDALRSAPAKCHGGTWHRKIPREPFNRYSKHRCY